MTDALNLCSFGSGIQSLSVQANKQETLNFYYRSNNARLGHFDACILIQCLAQMGKFRGSYQFEKRRYIKWYIC